MNINQELFELLETSAFEKLEFVEKSELLYCLPLLKFSTAIQSLPHPTFVQKQDTIVDIVSNFNESNFVADLLSLDVATLETNHSKSHLSNCLSLFETGTAKERIAIVLSVTTDFLANSDASHVKELFFTETVYQDEAILTLCAALLLFPEELSVSKVVSAFAELDDGLKIICPVILNSPFAFKDICRTLIKKIQSRQKQKPLLATFMQIIQLKPDYLDELILEASKDSDLSLVIELLLLKCNTMDVLSSLGYFTKFWLQALFSDGCERMTSSLKMAFKHQYKCATDLRQKMHQFLYTISSRLSNHYVPEAFLHSVCQMLHLYAAMKAMCGARLSDDECDLLLKIITYDGFPVTPASINFLKLGFCLILGLGQLLGTASKLDEIVTWMQKLTSNLSSFDSVLNGGDKFGEFFLLIAIHFHSSSLQAISELVASTFNTRGVVRTSVLSKFRVTFTEKVFPEKDLASFAVKIAVTENLNGNMTGHLTIHCIHQLLKARIFGRYGINVGPWILNQVENCAVPLHPTVLPVIDTFVLSCTHVSNKFAQQNQPIDEKFISATFKDPTKSFLCKTLLAYYLITYHDSCINHIVEMTNKKKTVYLYARPLYNELPIKSMLARIRQNSADFPGLLAPFLNLVATHFPQLCTVDNFFDVDISAPPPALPRPHGLASLFDTLEKLDVTHPSSLRCLNDISGFPATDLELFSVQVVKLLSRVLNSVCTLRIFELVKVIWQKIDTCSPSWFHLETVNSLRCVATDPVKFSQEALVGDPLLVLRCDRRVLHKPPLLEIVLRLLTSYEQQLKVSIHEHVTLTPITERGVVIADVEREELKRTLIISLDSAMVQILLEMCQSDNFTDQPRYLMDEIRCIICSFIHQLFTNDKECRLVKLLQFQGYPLELVEMTVHNIPSMHICFSFIPELLSQPQYEKHVFAIFLLAALCEHYRIPQAYVQVRLTLSCLSALCSVLTRLQRAEYFSLILPQLLKMAKVFPSLTNEIIEFLLHLQKFCICGFATHKLSISSDFSHQQRVTNSEMKLKRSISEAIERLVDDCLLTSSLF